MADPIDIAWAAGLFEGEGCITANQRRPGGSVILSLVLVSTDMDVVERFASVVGAGSIRTMGGSRPAHWKETYQWRIGGRGADRVVGILQPWLGTRRQRQLADVYTARREAIDVATRERPCAQCGDPFRPPYTRLSTRTKFCSSSCRRLAERHREAAA